MDTEQKIQFIQTTPTDLIGLIRDEVKSLIKEVKPHQEPKEQAKEFLTRKETATLFGISLVTVHDWTNKGTLKPYKMGNKTYYKYSELLGTLYSSNTKKK